MKIFLATLACLASAAAFAADDAAIAKAQAELRVGCAQSHASFSAHHPAGNAPEYRGDKYPGDTQYYADAKPCTEEQLAAYLDKADPTLVMTAYPSAAGRPKAKKPATSASKAG
ncbi:MAG: hypothetical protein JF607_12105 [Burkholderiales bacterium]|nr:hypothetical protein [Burkholderiales bacterium]MBW8893949.1 hypothetical protein [Burkholderiales bacterium]